MTPTTQRFSTRWYLSFFAFTATPKFKTKVLFDEPGPSGEAPFHEYSMRQAIEEGFILDVLANYTTYKRFYGLIKQIEDDPEVPRKQAAKALTRFLELHPVNIEQVVSVIIEHFRLYVMHELGGRAKAMVVTGSRLAAVKYKLAFDRYIQKHGYTGIRSLVAFSGTVEDPDDPGSAYTEVSMNQGLPESELEKLYTFVRNLLAKLPPPVNGQRFKLDDEVALRYFRLQQMTEGSIDLAAGDAYPLKGPTDVGTGAVHDDPVELSTLVDKLNERFGTDFTEADELFFDQIRASAGENERIVEAARANNLQNFSSFLERRLDELFIERMEGNEEIFSRIMSDPAFRTEVQQYLAREIFDRVRQSES